jgi:predicted metalloprotease
MQWKGRRESSNVEDRRGGGGAKRGAALGGVGTILVIIIALIMGKNPLQLLQTVGNMTGGAATEQTQPAGPQADDEAASFVKVVLADNEDVWHKIF